jgi:hypothetical protein
VQEKMPLEAAPPGRNPNIEIRNKSEIRISKPLLLPNLVAANQSNMAAAVAFSGGLQQPQPR